MKIKVISVDKNKLKVAQELASEYTKRITWPLQIIDVVPKHKHQIKAGEGDLIAQHFDAGQYLVCLDENGDNLSSHEFAAMIAKAINAAQNIVFVIGGASGIDEKILSQANKKIAFGRQTWPHKFVKFMLLEQVYRAQQIVSGHPYHKD